MIGPFLFLSGLDMDWISSTPKLLCIGLPRRGRVSVQVAALVSSEQPCLSTNPFNSVRIRSMDSVIVLSCIFT